MKQQAGVDREVPRPVFRRLLLPLLIAWVLLAAGGGVLVWRQYRAGLSVRRDVLYASVVNELQVDLRNQAEGLGQALTGIKACPRLSRALLEGRVDDLLLDWQPVFDDLFAEYGVTHFYFMETNRTCLLRVHEPERRGGVIERYTALEAEQTGTAARGVELGPLGMLTLRMVMPVHGADGRLAGYVELGKEVESIFRERHEQSGSDLALLIHKHRLDRDGWEAGMRLLGRGAEWDLLEGRVVSYASTERVGDLLALLAEDEFARTPGKEAGLTEVREGSRVWHAGFMPFRDAAGQEVGELLIVADVTEEERAFRRELVWSALGAAFLLVFLLVVVVGLLRRTDRGILNQQAALRKHEGLMAATLRSIGDGVISCDNEGRVTGLNAVAEQLTGWEEGQALGRPVGEVFHIVRALTRERQPSPVEQALREGVTVGLANHTVLIARGGGEYQIADSCAPIRDDAGRVLGAVLVFRDVTGDENRRAALRETNEMLEGVLDAIPDVIGIQRPDHVMIRYNKAGYELLGVTPREVAGKRCYELLGRDTPCADCVTGQAVRSGHIETTERYVPEMDRYLLCRSNPVYDENGSIRLVVEQIQDITARRRAEQELERQSAFLKRVIDSIGSPFLVIRAEDYTVEMGNPASGFDESMKGIKCHALSHRFPMPCGGDMHPCPLEEVKRTGGAVVVEHEHFLEDGRAMHVEVHAYPVFDDAGRVVKIIEHCLDVTERKQAEQDRQFHHDFQRIVAEAGAALGAVLTDAEFDWAIDRALARLGELFGVDRAYLFLMSEDQRLLTNTHEWCAEGIEPQIARIQNTPIESMPWWRDRMEQVLLVPDVEALPPEAENEQREWRVQGIRSLICVPTKSSRGELTGFIGFDSVRARYAWSSDHIPMIEMVAGMVGTALVRRRVEEALRESEERYRTFIERISDGVYRLELRKPMALEMPADAQVDFLYDHAILFECNDAYARMFGAERAEEVQGKTLLELHGTRERPANRAALREFIESGYRTERSMIEQADGQAQVRVFNNSAVGILEEGFLVRIWGTQTDVTERVRDERLRQLSLDVLAILNGSDSFERSIERILAKVKSATASDAVGIRIQHGDDYPYFSHIGFPDEFLRVENSLHARDEDGGFCREPDGSISLACTCGLVVSGKTDPAHPLFTPGGSAWTNDALPFLDVPPEEDPRLQPRNECIHQGYASIALVPLRAREHIVGILQVNAREKGRYGLELVQSLEWVASRIAETLLRRQAEEALRESEGLLAQSQRIGQIGSWRLEVDSGRLIWSREIYRIFGLDPEQFAPSYEAFLECIHPDDRTEVNEAYLSSVREGRRHYEVTHRVVRRDDGAIRHVYERCFHERDADGRVVRSVGMAQDITERKQAEDALRESEQRALQYAREAEAANEAKSQFLANMSHEIRTPMNGVLGIVPLLQASELNDHQRMLVRTIESSGQALLHVINDILDFSKIEAHKLTLAETLFALRDLVEEVALMMAVQAHARQLELVCSIAPDVPVGVRGDPDRIRQILVNLLGNAIKFTEAGEVVVRVERGARGQEGSVDDAVLLRLSVSDTGMGIPQEKLASIFESFSQADGSLTRTHGGTGLGLTIARELARLMGGDITARSTPGEGSVFTCTLRLGADLEERVPRPAPPDGLRDVRVLLVDGHETGRAALRQALESWGMLVEACENGAAARAAAERAHAQGGGFDLCLVDAALPEDDAAGLGRALLADPRHAALKLALLSSPGGSGKESEWRAAGFGAFLTKPMRSVDLSRALVELLGGDAGRAPAVGKPSRASRRQGCILVVEDNPTNLMAISLILQHLGLSVREAEDGAVALDMIEAEMPDLVFMDVQMPVMDGVEATRRLRAREATRQLPIVALTAHVMQGDRERFLAAGMNDCLAKPIEPDALVEVLDRWLPGSGA